MSITLMAYPTAFLISPEKANKEGVKLFKIINSAQSDVKNNLRSIRVMTNLNFKECQVLLQQINTMDNGLMIELQPIGNTCCVILSGCKNADLLQKYGEEFFQNLDHIVGHNVREIRSKEYFYYTYETSYKSAREIYDALKQSSDAQNVYLTNDESFVTAKVAGDNVKYFKQNDKFMLEVTKQISIVNIGLDADNTSYTINNSPLQSTKIQTNIKPNELTDLLRNAGYTFLRGNGQMILKTPNSTLNWHFENNLCVAEFSGPNPRVLGEEIEEIFRNLNKMAKRDLRLIDNQSRTVFTYNTNYTDKGILINTLTEHGASNLVEQGDNISCKLFDMDMHYKKTDNNAYVLEITRVSNIDDCQNLMCDLNEEYGLNIQEMTYNKIKERLQQENMRLEDETVLDDNSIVLTIDVG